MKTFGWDVKYSPSKHRSYDDAGTCWLASAGVEVNGKLSVCWTQACYTRTGARMVAKRKARKMRKASQRGELA